ncbi:putative defensin-like protein 238 [Capsella rubella]|uniref:putative defensin-like protein 238 n=1 Tax=Capsella rubella TaxID=81985 RepID=UPI000CD4F617|nr:putative defensin-like protein 238 [Capsella rubella]
MRSTTLFIVLCVFMFIALNNVKGQAKPKECQIKNTYRGNCGTNGSQKCLNILNDKSVKRCDCSETKAVREVICTCSRC